jgi:DNA-binding response OmpR family regulator
MGARRARHRRQGRLIWASQDPRRRRQPRLRALAGLPVARHGPARPICDQWYAAQEIARRFKPEIIILDIGLPDTDGYRLARTWKSDPEMKAVKIVALTAYGTEEHKQRSKEAGIDQHVVKPLDPKRLAELIAAKN